ncbi:conserved hypothetical protein [Hyella patelloides LEGE 07179]|uniref:Uncharacterized protein n=1 Tax=Hyella patelloides LEGE 07179 TaxID=945734 RepID=A0A563VR40_9CYAN|nr:hypothetical protein [Hyella patelloides]VEP13859.1 conserved hypothetical protein [Hyella patelloides LEGE 07179]
MNDLERIREEMITILVLILTLAFTSSNLTPESLEEDHQPWTERLPLTVAYRLII